MADYHRPVNFADVCIGRVLEVLADPSGGRQSFLQKFAYS
jgi:hypothetical protein